MTEELKPCPFCGEEMLVRFHALEQAYSVECVECFAQIPYAGLSKSEAVAACNTRAPDADALAEIDRLADFIGDCGKAEADLRGIIADALAAMEQARDALAEMLSVVEEASPPSNFSVRRWVYSEIAARKAVANLTTQIERMKG